VGVACLGNPELVGVKVYAPSGDENVDDVQTTEEAQSEVDLGKAAVLGLDAETPGRAC
jgi:hypothetical protein